MEILTAIISVVGTLLTCTIIVNFILFKKQSKRIKEAETRTEEVKADSAKYEMYELRLKHANETIDEHNGTLKEQAQTISKLNHALDDKTLQIRKLTQQCEDAQNEVNRVNNKLDAAMARITQLTEERDAERLSKERYKNWHCRRADCKERIPPNPALRGQSFEKDDREEELTEDGGDEELIVVELNRENR